jgi:hypothetical protein
VTGRQVQFEISLLQQVRFRFRLRHGFGGAGDLSDDSSGGNRCSRPVRQGVGSQ